MFERIKKLFKPKDDIIRSVEDLQEALKDQPHIKILEITRMPDMPELKLYISPEEKHKIQLDCKRNKR